MGFHAQGPLNAGGKWEEFSDGEGGEIRIEWRIDLDSASLEIWGGRPDDDSAQNSEHGTLSRLGTLSA